jgi:uncharacterized membrane protein YbhN (UPF0104 family)
VHQVWHALTVFVDHLQEVTWKWVGIAVACHVTKLLVISRAWRNAIAAAYPGVRVSWLRMFGAYVAGTGINSVLPARGGEAVKLYIAKHRVEGSTYPTLAATIVLLTALDSVIAGALAIWAIAIGVLPALKLLPHLPSFDFAWFFAHPRLGGAIAGTAIAVVIVLIVWGGRRVEEFWRRVRQGFAALRPPRRYLRTIVFWQLCDWGLRLATIFFLLRAFSVDATARNALLVQVAMSLSTIFPLSPNGIGTEQALLLYVFRGAAASRTLLLSFSVGMRVTLSVVNAVLGFAAVLIMLRTVRVRRVLGDAQAAGSTSASRNDAQSAR